MTRTTAPGAVLAAALLAPALLLGAEVVLPDIDRIDGDPVVTLLPPDRIPAVDDPELVPADQAGFMRGDEPILGVVHDGVAKAYSLWHLDRHEIVNDRLGGDPVAVTW